MIFICHKCGGLIQWIKAIYHNNANTEPWPRPDLNGSYTIALLREINIKTTLVFTNHIAPPDPAPVSGRGGRAGNGA